MNVEAAKASVLHVLVRKVDSEDFSGLMGFDPLAFERLVHLVEDHDPFWLAKQLRDPQYPYGLRVDIAGMLRGPNANRLLLELLGA